MTPERGRNEEGGGAKVGGFPPKKTIIPGSFQPRSTIILIQAEMTEAMSRLKKPE